MKIRKIVFMALAGAVMTGCSTNNDTGSIGVQHYMPDNAVIAHRGTVYWAPELTEAAYRWARNAGADYVELDVRRSKDSVLVIMHDDTFRRTTDVAEIFPGREGDPVGSFTYEEIMQLDAGSAFNEKNPERARDGFRGQDVLVFEDVFRIAEGKRIKRNADGSRIYTRDAAGVYHFEYEPDPADNGHRPGIYIETKVPNQYPRMEEQVYDELARFGWNPLEGEEISIDEPFWSGDRVNIGKTRGKVLLQTFSRSGMVNFQKVFHEQVLCSFLVSNPRANIFALDEVMDDIIVFALSSGAQFIGTNLGDENDGLSQAFSDKIHAAHLKANIYSINTVEEMEKYFGKGKGRKASPLADGMITNRTDLTVDFYNERKVRKYGMLQAPGEILADLGY